MTNQDTHDFTAIDEQPDNDEDNWEDWSQGEGVDVELEELSMDDILTTEELVASLALQTKKDQQKKDQPYSALVKSLQDHQQTGDRSKNNPSTTGIHPAAVQRIIEELESLSDQTMKKFGYRIQVNEENIFQWSVFLTDFPTDSQLYQDMKKTTQPAVELEVTFPADYPFAPPFIRVIKPRFQYLTGHITVGGSVCMEVLTRSGWVPSYTLEGLLMQIKAEIVDGGARVDFDNQLPYSKTEAEQAFRRVAARYGWQ